MATAPVVIRAVPTRPVMPIDALDEEPVVVIAGYGVTRAEYADHTPHRWRDVAGTEPLGSWARRGDLVLAYDRLRDRTEVAEVVGKLVERDSATVHWPDRRWSHCRLSDIVALLEPAPGPDGRWTS
jgi:hypothetical protein